MKWRNKRVVVFLLCSLATMILFVPSTVNGQDKNLDQNKGGAKALRALKQELNEAGQEWVKRLNAANSDEERNALRQNSSYRMFEPRFLALARKYENDDAAVDALKWIAENANPGPVFDQALALLEEHYIEHEDITEICRTLEYRSTPEMESFFLAVARKHPEQDVQGLAYLSLARYLASTHYKAKVRQANKEKWLQSAKSLFTDDIIAWMCEADPIELSERIEVICKTIISDYGKLPDEEYKDRTREHRTLGDAARALQFSVDPVGRVAPKLIGKDANGKLVSSTNLRGKVVLLMFSANWCGPCKQMYGQLRELTKIYADKPFTVVTVMADNKLATVSKAVQSGEITWPAIWDGPNGPIASAWNVISYPTTYLIERDGRIQSHGLRDDTLDDEVAKLLGISPTSRIKPDKRTRVWSLSFRNQKINDADLSKLLDGYTELRMLDLSYNAISDEKLIHLLPLKKLTLLNLEHTGITDKGLQILKNMASLRQVYLYVGPGHKTTKAGRHELRKAIPKLRMSVITQ